MTSPARIGARLFAAALALTLLPTHAFSQDTVPTVHPWKLAYARRMAREGMEARERMERREQALRLAARKAKAPPRKTVKPTGNRARPAVPDYAFTLADTYSPTRHARAFGAHAFTPPANRIVNDRALDGAQSGQSETSIAAFGDLLLAAWNDGEGGFISNDNQGWAQSSDGGITWTDRGSPPHPGGVTGFHWTSDPALTVNEKSGAFYFSALCDFNDVLGDPRSGIAVIKGRWTAGVFNWETPVIARSVDAFTDFLDKEWVVADSVSGRVHMSYTRFPSGNSRIEFQSADSSLTGWTTPQALSLNNVLENGFVQGSRPIVDGNGRLYVVYELIGADVADFYRICRSDNLGVSFTAPVTAVSMYTNFGTGSPGYNRGRGVEFCGIAVDRSHGPNRGRLFLSWAESINWLDEVSTLGLSGNKSEVENNNTFGTATAVVVGQTVRGSLGFSDAVDYYSLVLAQGDHLVVASDSLESGADEAIHMRLIAGDGFTQLTHATIEQSLGPAGWLFTAPSAGTYYLRMSPFKGTGAYRLRTGLVHRGSERGRDQRDVFVGWSDDGTTWTEPVRLNEDPIGFDAFLPEVAVAADGGVYASWFDYRDSAPSKDGGEAGVYLARSGDGGLTWTTLGAVTDALTDWTATLTNIEPNQGDYMSLIANASSVRLAWSDGRLGNPDAFSAQIPLIPNGAQVAFDNLRIGNRLISMDWTATPTDSLTLRLYRSQDGGSYQYVAVVQFSLLGALSYTDTTVTGGHTYAYRLGRFTNGVELFYGQVRLFLPSTFPLFMAAPRPNPVVGNTFTASFSLATNETADLILHDISGREVFRQTIAPGMGPHTLALPVDNSLKQGLYVLTLRQGGHNASTRVHLLR
jgi:hypothetical protein